MISESSEQKKFVARVRSFFPDVIIFAVPNGGGRSPREGASLKAEGVLAGIPDLMIPEPRGGFNGLFIEMKRANVKSAPKHQREMMDSLRARGYKVELCSGADAAWSCFNDYMLLQNDKSRV